MASNIQNERINEIAAKLSLDRYEIYLNELPINIRIKILNKAKEIQKVDNILENLSFKEDNF